MSVNINSLGNLGYRITSGLASEAISASNSWLGKALGVHPRPNGKIEYYHDYDKPTKFSKKITAPIIRNSAQFFKEKSNEFVRKKVKRLLNGEQNTKLRTTKDLIKKDQRNIIQKHYGQLKVNLDNGRNDYVTAVDMVGTYCPTAFIMGIKLEKPIPYKVNHAYNINMARAGKERIRVAPETTDTLVWYDCTAMVTPNSSKNLILTTVQGRDYSRKELVSNGDIEFSVSGKMCSNVAGVYPEDEVEKFKQIMDYKGVIRCSHFVLGRLGIDKFIIKNWSLTPIMGFENVQEYSFDAVAIQPDKEIRLTEDTITILDHAIAESEERNVGWKGVIKDKLNQLIKNSADKVTNGTLDNIDKFIDHGVGKIL